MDEAFLIRARRMLGQNKSPRLDHDGFVAQLAARQAATPTARIAREAGRIVQTGIADSAAMLIGGREGWRGARAAQGGCFNRAVAVRPLNTP